MKKAEERKKYAEERQAKEAEKKKYTTKQLTGFAALQMDSDNEEEDDSVPQLQPIPPLIGGYAAALMKPKPVSAPKPAAGPDRIGEFKAITIQSGVKYEKKDDEEDEEELKRMRAEYAKKCKWMEDSDEEEEENSAW